jgi:hypothetical protein
MSWDAWLTDDRGHCEGDWNYTHNTNRMANIALDESGFKRPSDDRGPKSWWRCLNDLQGPDGAALLNHIIRGLQTDPERFRAMNPENGWGDYDTFLKVLIEMRNAVPEWPTVWSTSG